MEGLRTASGNPGLGPALLQSSQDTDAEEQFARHYAPRVLAVLRARLRDAQAAGELTNDVLLAVLNAVRAGRLLDQAKLGAFVMGTARNVANNYFRTCARRPREMPLSDEIAAGDHAASRERRQRVLLVFHELQSLDETDRAIVGLTLAQGLKSGEIARALNLRPQTVRARKCRAIRRLARVLRPVLQSRLHPVRAREVGGTP